MKNHFIIGYAGNKRQECDDIYSLCKFEGITTIVEPFCGSCAFSYYLSVKHPKKFKYILIDNSKHLIKLLNIMKDKNQYDELRQKVNEIIPSIKDSKTEYLKFINNKTFEGWMIANKYYTIRSGLFPINGARSWKPLEETYPIFDFLRNEDVEIIEGNGKEYIEKFKDDTDKLIFLDPPYLQTCNDFYEDKDCNIYEYLYLNNPINFKAYFVFALENIWINKLLFKDLLDKNNHIIKDKQYQTSKKKTSHFYFTNK